MNRQKIVPFIYVLVTVAVTAIWIFGCADKGLSIRSGEGFSFNFNAKPYIPDIVTQFDHFILTVTGIDSDTQQPFRDSTYMEYVNGELKGRIEVPAGPNRLFTASAYDKANVLLYQGITIADVFADQEVNLVIDMIPMLPVLAIQPNYQEENMNDSFPINVYAFNLPGLTTISMELVYTPGPFYLYGSTSPDVELGPNIPTQSILNYTLGNNSVFITLSSQGTGLPLVGLSGSEQLFTAHFDAYADWGDSTFLGQFNMNVFRMEDFFGDSISLDHLFTDFGSVYLYMGAKKVTPPDTGDDGPAGGVDQMSFINNKEE